jgi:hypothetical protein
MAQAIINTLWLIGGYVLAIFTWDKVHTFIIGAGAKADALRDKARALEASLRAKL